MKISIIPKILIPLLLITLVLFGSAKLSEIAVHAQGDPVIAGAGDISTASTSLTRPTALTANTIEWINPYAVLVMGDNQYPDGTLQQYTDYYTPTWGRFKAKTHPVPGNHEYHVAGAPGYFDYFNGVGVNNGPAGERGKGYYSYNIGSWHLIALNSEAMSTAQNDWLAADLAANQNATCTLAYWHHPRFSSGQHGSNTKTAPFWDRLYQYKADIVLVGHDHTYERFAPQSPSGVSEPTRGIRQFVVGTGGAGLYSFTSSPPNSEFRQNTSHGVLKLTLHPTSYDWQFIKNDAAHTVLDPASGGIGSGNCVTGAAVTSTPTPTGPTKTPTPSPQPTNTPTPGTFTPTPTPPTGGDVSYGFEDIAVPPAGGSTAVSGQHSGIAFGSSKWVADTSTSVLNHMAGAFSNEVASKTFILPSGKVLKSLRLAKATNTYVGVNGTATTINYSIGDGVNTAKTGTVTYGTAKTVTTGWTQAGATITITGNWDLYLDDIVYGNAGTATATPTPGQCTPNNGDTNGDGLVNLSDFVKLASNFNKNLLGPSNGDFNCNNVINLADFVILASHWTGSGNTPTPTPSPIPTGGANYISNTICNPDLGSAAFTTNITNNYLPFTTGYLQNPPNERNLYDSGTGFNVRMKILTDGSGQPILKDIPGADGIDPVKTLVLEEFETNGTNWVETSENWFAQTVGGLYPGTVCYFGEKVCTPSNPPPNCGAGGSWQAGQGSCRAGIMMPPQGYRTVGRNWLIEDAAACGAYENGVIESTGLTYQTPAGTFNNVIYILEANGTSNKRYAPNVGMISDEGAKLINY